MGRRQPSGLEQDLLSPRCVSVPLARNPLHTISRMGSSGLPPASRGENLTLPVSYSLAHSWAACVPVQSLAQPGFASRKVQSR